MARIKFTAYIDERDLGTDDLDPDDPTGLTQKAYMYYTDKFFGFDDLEITRQITE